MAESISNRQKVLIDDAIGTEYEIPEGDVSKLPNLIWRGSVDAYCPTCKRKSVFTIDGPSYDLDKRAAELPRVGVITVTGICQREGAILPGYACSERLFVCFRRKDWVLTKIGQWPSRAELDFGTLDEAFRELSPEFRRELGRAIGLRAHGVGIGSFVYLRRIFESLLSEAYDHARKQPGWNDAEYVRTRVTEKIQLLRDHLPSRLVQSASLYGILSKGLHELTEQECLELFDVVKQAIHYILAERHEQREYERLVKELNATGSTLLNG